MKGIKFGNYHSYDDFSLFLTEKIIELPKVKTNYVDILGADGQLDLTDYFGEPKYDNRILSFTFEVLVRGEAFYNLYNEIANKIHGKKLNIILDDDPDFYFEGRVNINQYKSSEKIGKIIIECECSPYQMEVIEMVNEVVLEGLEKEIALVNLKKRVIPTIKVTTSESVEISFGDYNEVLTSGIYRLSKPFEEGNNIVSLNGVGAVTFTYRRGKL